ncbi:MAG: GxxExxY protein [Sumerlaeia bacterium]
MLLAEDVTNQVIGAAIEVHRALGPGLLESIYEECLSHELKLRGLGFQRQVPLPIRYKDLELPDSYRMDLVVENLVVIELKSVIKLEPIHKAQLLTYLKLSRLPVGLLLNFNTPVLKDGLVRLVL